MEITPTYSGCPAMTEMRAGVARRLTEAGYRPEVRTVLDPPWSTDDITAHGRAVLRAHGIAPPGTAPRRTPGAPTPVQIGRRPPEVVCPRCGASATERVAEFGATAEYSVAFGAAFAAISPSAPPPPPGTASITFSSLETLCL